MAGSGTAPRTRPSSPPTCSTGCSTARSCIADPQHGEVRVVEAGEGVLFRRDTWHHGFNPSAETVRVLEFFAPPPSKGTASTYSVNQPDLASVRYHDTRWERRWPMAAAERELSSKLHVVQESAALWRFAHTAPSHLQGTLVDTEHLLVRTGRVAAGHVEDLHETEDETVLVVTSGQLWVDTRDTCTGDFAVACLDPGDARVRAGGQQPAGPGAVGNPGDVPLGCRQADFRRLDAGHRRIETLPHGVQAGAPQKSAVAWQDLLTRTGTHVSSARRTPWPPARPGGRCCSPGRCWP